jgi:aminoglycoside phosphotransferase (APT) family kinase protein
LVNKNQAFRFPRTKNHGKKDRIENVFLSVYAPTSPISVQEMVGHVDLKTGMEYQMYNFIPGVQLTKKIAKTLSEQELVKIAVDMGKFLVTLHSFPITQARSMHMDELDPTLYWKYFEDLYIDIKTVIFPLLSKEEQQWAEKLVNNYIYATKDNPYEVKVTHHDLLAEHILIDESTHALNGVIDFSLRIADPARDFEYFDRYGSLFLDTIYSHYLSRDKYFDRRRKFYAGHVPVINLYESIVRKDTKMTEKYLAELKEYIAQTNT